MAILERVWVTHTTSTDAEANTGAAFSLEISGNNQVANLDFPDLPHDERERGRTDQYEFDLRNWEIDHEDVLPGNVRLTIRGGEGGNAWLPQSIWVMGRTVDGQYHLLVARPDWPATAWFSTDHSDVGGTARTTRPLDQP